MDEPRWTLDELARRAQQALRSDDVREANGRAIRWYGTKGLVDRPAIGPGHSARYGERHLLQLVAVKRLQARGLSLAEVQRELAGATEEKLRRIADLEGSALAEELLAREPAPPARFWAARPAAAAAAEPEPPAAEIRYLIPLTEDVTLTLPAQPGAADLAAIRTAAAPLLALLAERGLTTRGE
ncbi:MAG TPA: MerR family transcriptional regulator [Actinospica sp.]|nr:MerR family transcriptional regulator [Actinospica sp.]